MQQELSPSKKYFIKTFGCQMNEADSERMSALMNERGMSEAPSAETADVLILNGCSVREKAVHKAVSALGRYRSLKKSGKGPIIGLGGCVGQLDKGKIFKRAPYLDFVFGTDALEQLPEILHRVENGDVHSVFTDFDRSNQYSIETKTDRKKSQAFVNVMKGCDKYCTYCIVPFTRGKEKSRTISEVVEDVARLVSQGVREITLLGQNVNSFGKGNANLSEREPRELHNLIGKVGPKAGEENFPQLLRAIDLEPRCKDLKRIRFTSSHPLDFSDELIDCYRPANEGGVLRLAPHLHLPVQSGSNQILQKMGRHHTTETYIAQMDRLREVSPTIGLSTDLIVGFPGESHEDFQATLRLLERVKFDNVYAFAYSVRPGTRAAKLVDDVPLEIKKQRLNQLLEYQAVIGKDQFALRIGKVVEVLVEGESKNQGLLLAKAQAAALVVDKDCEVGPAEKVRPEKVRPEKVWQGRTGCYAVVNFLSSLPRDLTGRFLKVEVTAASGQALKGKLVVTEVGENWDKSWPQ